MSDAMTPPTMQQQKFNLIEKLDERHVAAEVVDDGEHICIYTDKMHIDVNSARQLRDWLNSALPPLARPLTDEQKI